MEENMGTVFIDGKIYYLNELSSEELQELEKKLKVKEKEYQKKIVNSLKK